MDLITNKKELLDSIKLSEGPEFECNEEAILNEYQHLGENKSSISIKVLSILGGFLATLTFLGFLALMGLYDSEEVLTFVGLVFISGAILLNKAYDKLIIDTFSISIYVAGFALLAFGLMEMNYSENVIMISVASLALISLFVTQNYILSFLSILLISGSCFTFIMVHELYLLVHVYIAVSALLFTLVFLNEAKINASSRKLSKLYNPAKTGLLCSFLFGLYILGVGKYWFLPQGPLWISSITMVLVLFYLVYLITKITDVKNVKSKVFIYILTGLILLSTFYSPAISGALIIILLSFLVNYKTGVVVGVISFLYFIGQYYYDLNFTLLTKSIILFSTGILFLLFFLFTSKKIDSNEKV